ncbi:DEAD/DEAH box helicase family protein [bacterium]|nr:DEAD/DEAH box helicase family protein [bacterium]
MLTLKDYQQLALDALNAYFEECVSTRDADTAYYSMTRKTIGRGISYNPVKELPGLPYVCIRIPTGGGKTLVASHAVGLASRNLLHTSSALVLWLVPSNPIREQTLKNLKDRKHPYRKALESVTKGANVLDVEQALNVKPADLDTGVTVIVSTMQAFKVEDTVGRRVYKNNGDLMDHFSGLPEAVLAGLDRGEAGNLYHSLANVLRLRRPIVIVDEAHNARTPLTFETLARFNPSCILEFTATPDLERNPSNVLYTASAAELKAEAMIKMPIRLETRPDWRELLADAIACRVRLEKLAALERQESGEFIRPILLIQAQPQSKTRDTVSVDVVLDALEKDFRIPRSQIAVSTGEKEELESVEDIEAHDCPIRFIVTVQKLREGWDCPFAYVLCSVAEMKSTTYVEQILGRIMRLPKADWKKRVDLNMSYAFVASRHFYDVANSLTDALVQNGFDRQEARELIVKAPDYGRQDELPFDGHGPAMGTATVELPELPSVKRFSPEVQKKVSIDTKKKTLTINGPLTRDEQEEVKAAFKTDAGQNAVEKAVRVYNGFPETVRGTPSERQIEFAVPELAIRQYDMFEKFEETHLLDHPWSLSNCDALLSENDYSAVRTGTEQGTIDITEKGTVGYEFLGTLQNQMALYESGQGWKLADLVYWLDRAFPHQDISPQETGVFLTRLVQAMVDQRSIPLETLVHDKFRFRRAVEKKINELRHEAKNEAYQLFLDPHFETPLVVTTDLCFRFDPRQYPANRTYRGNYRFKKHYYPDVEDFTTKEEFECGQFIDALDAVDFWVRNVSRGRFAFSLQTSSDRFYPDFVAKLKDGRTLVVEYKGEHLWSNDDSKEKRNIGELWANRSEGKCLFVMPKGKDWAAIRSIISQ